MNYLHFIYTRHAKLRMRERGLTVNQVESTVRFPDRVGVSFGGRQIARRKFRSKTAEVVYKTVKGRIVIITAYWQEGEN